MRTNRIPARALACVALGLALCAPDAGAQPLPPDDLRTLTALLQAHLQQQAEAAAAREGFTRVEARLGPADTLAGLAAFAGCRAARAFTPPAARPWGRTSVGARCVDGPAVSVLVPAQVAVWGPALVAATALPAGTVLGPQDLLAQEVDLTREPAGLPRDPQALAGRVLATAVSAGQPLRPQATRAVMAVQAGDPVRVRMAADGFEVVAAGQALGAAAAGQPVRVRTELGRILTGTAREGRTVDVAP